MITWGISANSHDAALAVFDDDKLLFASHAERFSQIKNDPNLNFKLIEHAREFGLPKKVVWYENPYLKTIRQLYAGQGWNWKENNIKRYLDTYGINSKIRYTSHHESHAAGGYFTSKFRTATVVVMDSIGEFETLTVWKAQDNKLTKVFSQRYPNSIGLWYSAMTQRVGLKPNDEEYILMGMAAYGDPDRLYNDMLADFITIGEPNIILKESLHRGCKQWKPELESEQDMFDIAAATQKLYETILNSVLHWVKKNVPNRNLVLMGGCALNCSANHIAKKHFNSVWIMPNPGDAGSAIGSVLAKTKKHITWTGPYLGYRILGDYPINEAIAELKKTGIVGVANGPAEFGPRALGNRSLFADPRKADIKDRVNKIKQRQQFRPFAPVILEDYAKDYFKGEMNEYMQYTSRCLEPEKYPAIVHKDGTSRVQTVNRWQHPQLYQMLFKWHQQTGCPMLLNTSLNIKGMPMVNDEHDAHRFEKKYGIKVCCKREIKSI